MGGLADSPVSLRESTSPLSIAQGTEVGVMFPGDKDQEKDRSMGEAGKDREGSAGIGPG